MYLSKMFLPTRREIPAEAEILSHQLMLRAGMMRKLASGIYCYLPIGYRVLRKIESIVREEMNKAGAEELLMPALLPAEPYQATGRWDVYGPLMFKLKDRNNRDFCLGPTHEEMFTTIVNAEINSYKQLPTTLYQIQTKYRDELRPRFGVMRSREFIMKDAYSFDVNQEGLDESYNNMREAYIKTFDRCGLIYKTVEADSGAIGGSNSQEFMVKSEVGEDEIVFCTECDYAGNIEKSECLTYENDSIEEERPIGKVHTPNIKTIDDLNKLFNGDGSKVVKTILYRADNKVVAVMVRGDRAVNETKLINLLGCIELELADADSVKKATGAEVGFAGPVGLNVEVYVDSEVSHMKNFIVGANETNYHLKNVNMLRDFKAKEVCDLRNITINDPCPNCKGKIEIAHGIEVGHIFKLGTKYSKSLSCTFIDENGKEQLMVMGCYGIGVSRIIAAIVEQNSDQNGVIWPMSVAPYKVIVVPVMANDEVQFELAKKIYTELTSQGIDTILDDRDERAGVKFKDADLIGIPVRVTVGKKAGEGVVEFKQRNSSEVKEMRAEQVMENVLDIINKSIM